MSLSLFTNDPFFNDPFFSESRIAPLSNMLGGNMNMNRMMTAMPLRITETDDKFKVLAEIPGVTSKKDIDIKLDQGVLSIEAEKKERESPRYRNFT